MPTNVAEKPAVEFFFDASCPWSYLALERVRELIANKQPPDRSDAGLNAAKLAEEP